MRHIIFGGDGFVGRHLAPKLLADGHEVIVADIAKGDFPHYRSVRHIEFPVNTFRDIALDLEGDVSRKLNIRASASPITER